MKKLKSGIELYDEIPTTLRLRYASVRATMQKGGTYTFLGIGRVPLRDGNSYDAAVLTDGGNEIYVAIPIMMGLVFKKQGENWTRKQIDGGLNVDQLEKLVGQKITVKDFVTEEVTNFQGNNVMRQFPIWETA